MPQKNPRIALLLALAACLTFGVLAIAPRHVALAARGSTSFAAAPAMQGFERGRAPEPFLARAQATATARASGGSGMSSGTKAAIAVLVVAAVVIIMAAAYFNQQRRRGIGP